MLIVATDLIFYFCKFIKKRIKFSFTLFNCDIIPTSLTIKLIGRTTKGDNMKEKEYYQLTPSQDVSYLQCKYTLDKRVINILTSITFDEEIDFDLMHKAFNIMLERHDCLSIKFKKREKSLIQYFGAATLIEQIPVHNFTTKKEQDKFIEKVRKSPIKYLKGELIEPHFIRTHEGKQMVFLKVCHLVLDIYGISIIFKDLIAIYDSLKNDRPLPQPPAKYEEVVKKDLERKNDKTYNDNNRQFFTKLINDNPEPYYAGLHGSNNKIWQKKLAKGNRGMKMFFVHNDTRDYCHKITADVVEKIYRYCEENKCSPATFMLYTCALTAAKINNNTQHLLPLALYNCRGSILEKSCAGTKVQSVACHTDFNYNATFNNNFSQFNINQFALCKHLGFPDREFEILLHKTYRSSWLETYYSLTLSFLPMELPDGVNIKIYSNQKCALPAYIVQLLNVKTNEIDMFYDVQIKIISEKDVEDFHQKYISILKQVTENPNKKLSEFLI